MKVRMRMFVAIILLVAIAGGAGSCSRAESAAPARTVKVQFVVTVPDDTDSHDTIWLSGNADEMGNWTAQGVQLARHGGSEYAATVSLPRGATIEYKANRGSWATVEKGAGGEEIANRTLLLDSADRIVRITVASWRKPRGVAPAQPTIVGDVRFHRDFHSRYVKDNRALIVWLPPGYDAAGEDAARRYPVLYMHDGQNLFDAGTSYGGEWRADETATRLIDEKRIEPIIIVGIENAGPARVDEYTPTRAATTTRSGGRIEEGGNGEAYEKFLVEEVKPFIDRTYRTLPDRQHTAVVGSSLGGLISLHLAWKHGDVFGMCGCLSPSLWWDNHKMLLSFELDSAWMRRERFWIDIGTAEGSGSNPQKYLLALREMHAIMRRAGLIEGRDFRYTEYEGATHDEQSWAARFDEVLLFFFGTGR